MTTLVRDMVEEQILTEIHALAWEMVRLDDAERRAYQMGEWDAVGVAQRTREIVQQRRSDLMHDIWVMRRHRRKS